MAGADVVFHLAGQAGIGFSIEHPREVNEANVNGTLNVLSLARKHDVKRVVNASSSSIFGEPEYLPIDEKHPTNPTSPYGVSKLAAEQYARAFSRVYGTYVVSLRYFSVYGPRGRPDQVIHRFTKSLAEGKAPVIQGDGSHTRDFTYVIGHRQRDHPGSRERGSRRRGLQHRFRVQDLDLGAWRRSSSC